MKIICDKNLIDFDFCEDARMLYNELSYSELKKLNDILEIEYPNGITDVQLNDLFWLDKDHIIQLLGYKNYEQFDFIKKWEDCEYEINHETYKIEYLEHSDMFNVKTSFGDYLFNVEDDLEGINYSTITIDSLIENLCIAAKTQYYRDEFAFHNHDKININDKEYDIYYDEFGPLNDSKDEIFLYNDKNTEISRIEINFNLSIDDNIKKLLENGRF